MSGISQKLPLLLTTLAWGRGLPAAAQLLALQQERHPERQPEPST